MASKRRKKLRATRRKQEKRARQCEGKITYHSWDDATLAAHAVSQRKGEELFAYQCPHCSRPGDVTYHIGHDVRLRGQRPAPVI